MPCHRRAEHAAGAAGRIQHVAELGLDHAGVKVVAAAQAAVQHGEYVASRRAVDAGSRVILGHGAADVGQLALYCVNDLALQTGDGVDLRQLDKSLYDIRTSIQLILSANPITSVVNRNFRPSIAENPLVSSEADGL